MRPHPFGPRISSLVSRLLVATLSTGLLILPQAALAACNWRLEQSGNFAQPVVNFLQGVAAISTTDAWAVGTAYSYGIGNSAQTYIERWNGLSWSQVPSPDPGVPDLLNSVTAISSNDVWAVGWRSDSFGNPFYTLIEHWNGSVWSVTPSPDAGSNDMLNGVAAVSANDVWAVGTLIVHWNGTRWAIVPSPSVSGLLNSVSVVNAHDIWAVGYYFFGGREKRTLTEHWDGRRWMVVPSPNPKVKGQSNPNLYSVAATSRGDVWAVGSYQNGLLTDGTLIEHWKGYSWTIIPSPNENTSDLYSVTASSASDAWAVGSHVKLRGPFLTLTEHWDGAQWTIVPSPNAVPSGVGYSDGSNYLAGVATIGPNDFLSVGHTDYPSYPHVGDDTLTLHFHC